MPIEHSATPSFKDLSRETRHCKLREEVDEGSIFMNYSQKGCIFECMLTNMVSHRIHISTVLHGSQKIVLLCRLRELAANIVVASCNL